MNRLIQNHIDKLFIALVILIFFSSGRNLLVTHYVLGGAGNTALMTLVFILVVMLFLLHLVFSHGSLYIRHSQKKLIIVSACLAGYFFMHEFIFGDSFISAKYAVFLFLIILSLMVRYNAYFVFKVLGYIGGFVSLIIILQQFLLLTINNGDISQFNVVIDGEEWSRANGCDYVAPYGLGLIERCIWGLDVNIYGFKINRSIFFSTEPKYISSLLLVTLASILISKTESLLKFWSILLHLAALIFISSASSILILFISLFLILIRVIGPILYSSVVFLFPIFVLPLLFSLLAQITGIDGFILNRLMSASSDIGEGGLQTLSFFGQAYGACDKSSCDDDGLLSNLIDTYGMIGLVIFWFFLYFLIRPMFKIIRSRNINISTSLGLMILLNTYIVFNLYFFGDIFNMFGLMILLTIILLPEYIEENKTVISSNNVGSL